MESVESLLPLIAFSLGAALGFLLRKKVTVIIAVALGAWFFSFRKELFRPDIHLAKDDFSFFLGTSVMFVLMYGVLAFIGASVGIWLDKRLKSRREKDESF